MSDENSTTKKGMADPLPLLPFTYAICMVVSSIVLMMMGDEMKRSSAATGGDGGGSLHNLWCEFLFGYS